MTKLLLKLWRALHLSKETQISIMRLFQDKFLVGVTGVIFDEKDQILLFKHTYRQIQWGLPGGYIGGHEHPIQALEREIEEESGLVISIDERLQIKLEKSSSRLDICYLGTFIGGEFKKSGEVEAYGLFPLANLPLIPKEQLLTIHEAITHKQLHRRSFAVSMPEKPPQKEHFFTRLHLPS